MGYTRRGQQDKITRGTNTWQLFYTLAGQLLSEAGTAGTLNGLRVTNAFDAYLRRTNLASANGASILTTNGYTLDAGGRLSTARDGTFLATYSYLANSPLVGQIQSKSNSFVSLTTTKTYDALNRLSAISSQPSAAGAAPIAYAYSYNDANQRTRVNMGDGSFWIYEYDSLGQVKSGKRYWSDWTPVAGQQFEYGFDDIGNRTSTKSGGDSTGANLRSASYTNNTLNQITGRDVPAYLNILGAATATATNVNVNNVMAYRRGEYYHGELNSPNTSAAVWQTVTNRAVQGGTTNSATGNLFLPKHPEVFGYDADGNLTNDGRWMLTWDAENRLTKAESQTSAPTTSKRKLEFTYDWRGILIRRIEYNGSSGSYVVTNDLKFLNDSLHCIAELNGTNNALIRSYLWGLDLSGTMNGAGSVGGLLLVNSKANGAHFPAYDGNGNVAALVNAADGTVSARYDYSPFGERLRATGPMAGENVYCFSTKRYDSALDLVLYEFRPLKPDSGTWLSRDPIGEKDGPNLNLYVGNDAVNWLDADGKARLRFPNLVPDFPWPPRLPDWFPRPRLPRLSRFRLFKPKCEIPCPFTLENLGLGKGEFGVGPSIGATLLLPVSGGGLVPAVGVDVSATAMITSGCKVCVSIQGAVLTGGGLLASASYGAGAAYSQSGSLEGGGSTIGAGGGVGFGYGLSGSADIDPQNESASATAGRVGPTHGGGVYGRLGHGCTGCADTINGSILERTQPLEVSIVRATECLGKAIAKAIQTLE